MSDEPEPWPVPDELSAEDRRAMRAAADEANHLGSWRAATPEAPQPKPASVQLCGHCGKTIYWRRPNTKLRLAGGWKHEATGFAGCGYGALTTATPREDPTP